MKNLNNKTIFITGGTGSFGKNFTKFLLNHTNVKKIIVFSRDENKQFHMQKEIQDKRLRFFIGDVRDLPRLQRALSGVDIVVHAAALKHVPALEYNPYEAVKTNILGSQNVIEAAIDRKISKILLISTDKAAQPVNLYGSTKLCAEKLFINANVYAPSKSLFSAVRYGNVIGSRGSIVETLKNKNTKKVQITDKKMTRFWITLTQAFNLVLFALKEMQGGEIFIPKAPSMKLIDVFDALAPQSEKEIIGIRPGEKLHEILLTEQEALHSLELDKYYVILPEYSFYSGHNIDKYKKYGKKLDSGFKYTSDTNKDWLTKKQFIELSNQI